MKAVSTPDTREGGPAFSTDASSAADTTDGHVEMEEGEEAGEEEGGELLPLSLSSKIEIDLGSTREALLFLLCERERRPK